MKRNLFLITQIKQKENKMFKTFEVLLRFLTLRDVFIMVIVKNLIQALLNRVSIFASRNLSLYMFQNKFLLPVCFCAKNMWSNKNINTLSCCIYFVFFFESFKKHDLIYHQNVSLLQSQKSFVL